MIKVLMLVLVVNAAFLQPTEEFQLPYARRRECLYQGEKTSQDLNAVSLPCQRSSAPLAGSFFSQCPEMRESPLSSLHSSLLSPH